MALKPGISAQLLEQAISDHRPHVTELLSQLSKQTKSAANENISLGLK